MKLLCPLLCVILHFKNLHVVAVKMRTPLYNFGKFWFFEEKRLYLLQHKKEEFPLSLGHRKTLCRAFVQVARGCFLLISKQYPYIYPYKCYM